MGYAPQTAVGRWLNGFEETLIALILGAMTLITFVNVVVRKLFDGNILWQVEATVFLFAWLVLFGVSHAVKTASHLGVDVLINLMPPGPRRACGLLAVLVCIGFSLIMLKGAWDYWSSDLTRFEVDSVPAPAFLFWLGLERPGGGAYEYLPRYVPYFILPFGMALLTFRFLQAGWRILRGEADRVIAAHEAEDAMPGR